LLLDAMEERKYVETGSDRITLLSQLEDRMKVNLICSISVH